MHITLEEGFVIAMQPYDNHLSFVWEDSVVRRLATSNLDLDPHQWTFEPEVD